MEAFGNSRPSHSSFVSYLRGSIVNVIVLSANQTRAPNLTQSSCVHCEAAGLCASFNSTRESSYTTAPILCTTPRYHRRFSLEMRPVYTLLLPTSRLFSTLQRNPHITHHTDRSQTHCHPHTESSCTSKHIWSGPAATASSSASTRSTAIPASRAFTLSAER